MDDYDKRVAQLERERTQSDEARTFGAANQTRALTVGLALGAVGFVLADVVGAGAMFVCGYVAAAWVGVETSRRR